MQFDIITLFPNLFDSFVSESLIAKACDKKLVDVRIHNLRDFTNDKHHTADDKPYGGGAGMLLKIEPLVTALKKIKKKRNSRVILLSPAGKQFTQKHATVLAKKYDQIIFICGRYEGVDARIKHYIDELISVGPYVLNGGEVATMAVIESVFRLIPDTIGNPESLKDESWNSDTTQEYPQYTRPEVFDGHRVPKVLLSGDHKKIDEWKRKRTR
ncbi:MAG: tRNA (guanosine(37)-N1)-methyltransferase TrmD [Candidatus Uhrbacteria bacterium]|nr:tRNA (guanosine(37)-N1)-methyltransferase TrmD [Candidatus Uhrbacteria bacterium]